VAARYFAKVAVRVRFPTDAFIAKGQLLVVARVC